MIAIRPFETRDSDAVRQMFAQLTGYAMTPEEMQDRVAFVEASPIDWLVVAELDGQVCGVLVFHIREAVERPRRFGEIAALVSDASARRKGVGRALVEAAERMAHEHNCVGTWLVSGFARKDEAHRFYTSLGYETTGYRFVKFFEE